VRGGLYHDTHTASVPKPVLDLLAALSKRARVPGVLLERDGDFPTDAELHAELDAIVHAVQQAETHKEIADAC
jgi:uncharacterized protein (UPF0276 family)